MLQFQSLDPQRNLGFQSLGLGFYNCQKQLGSLRHRNFGNGLMFGGQVKTMELEGYKHGGVQLGACRWSRRSFGSCVVKVRSLLSHTAVERDENGKVGEEKRSDAIVIGSGIGGLVAATQLAVKGAKVLVLEKYVIPGGSSGFYQRDGYTFDVGSSVMFGFSDKVSFNNYYIPS